MTKDAMLACIVCGVTLENVLPDESINQPSGGTEFRTYGHYGSTFWDSFQAEQIVINVCDGCLRERTDRIGRHKRYASIVVRDKAIVTVGWQAVRREMVPYFEGPEEDTEIVIEPEEIGTLTGGGPIRWIRNWADYKADLLAAAAAAAADDADGEDQP